VLKGPWCNLDDDDGDIFPLAYGRGAGETLHTRLMANDAPKYAPAQALVRELAARSGADPFAFLSWALETPHGGGPSGWARVFARLGEETRDPVQELLQRALKPGVHAAPSLHRFLHEIEGDSGQVKRELEAAGGAVRVMTVHGAKGLEAPVVILPDCTGPVSDKPEDGLLFEQGGPFVCFRERDDDAAVSAARADYRARMLGEHWRLLYVGMTRARDRLIVCGAQHGNAAGGEAKQSWRGAVVEALTSLAAAPCETPFGEGLRLGAPLNAAAALAQQHAPHAPAPGWLGRPAPEAMAARPATPSHITPVDPNLFSPRRSRARLAAPSRRSRR
jgi:ATP-dependent helicase/nuclease subunit A